MFCIVPPHILRALAESDDPRLRAIGNHNLAVSARLRESRGTRGKPRPAAPPEEHRIIYDAHGTVRLPGRAVRREDAPPSPDPVVNQAYTGLGATFDLYARVFGRDSIDGRGLRLAASVHYGIDYDNAFWDGTEMVFGDGDQIIFVGFTGALDVVGHELTHGVTEYTSNLAYRGQSGALNESFSDVFGSLVKQYYLGQDAASADWLIGEGLFAADIAGRGLRSMKDPGSAYDDPRLGGRDPQPGHMRDYVHLPETPEADWGGVHLNSGIPNRAFYLTASALGGPAWETAGPIWYATLLRLPSNASFADCAALTVAVATEIHGARSRETKATREAWRTVGVVKPAARRPARRPKVDLRTFVATQLVRLATRLRRTAGARSRA